MHLNALYSRRMLIDTSFDFRTAEVGEFVLCSDTVIPSFTRWVSLRRITELFTEEENEAFRTIGYTIGGMMVFPGNRIDRRRPSTALAGAIGRSRTGSISRSSPFFGTILSSAALSARRWPGTASFSHYSRTSKGTSNFFMLQDLVTKDCSEVRFFMPFDDFNLPAVPTDRDTYKEYRRLSWSSSKPETFGSADIPPFLMTLPGKGKTSPSEG